MSIGQRLRTCHARPWWRLASATRPDHDTDTDEAGHPDRPRAGKCYAYPAPDLAAPSANATHDSYDPSPEAIALNVVPSALEGPWLVAIIQPFKEPIQLRVLGVAREVLIGRDPSAAIRLAGSLVSRRHALVRACAHGLTIEDISSNGTLVDGTPLHKSQRDITDECQVIIGCNRVRLRRLTPLAGS